MADVLAYAEIRDGALGKPARETVATARAMADALGGAAHAIALGPRGIGPATAELGAVGADRILAGEDERLSICQPDVAAATVAAVAATGGYAAILFPATAQGKDVAPRAAARLESPLATEVVGFSVEGGTITVRRPVYAGKAIATMRFERGPAVMTLRANVFSHDRTPGAGAVESISVDAADPRVAVTGVELGERDQLDVAEATIIVSGGRGLQGPENWHLLEDLVAALGDEATLGASRAVVDAGWRPHGEQVGQTGKTVSPNLYFAVGVSGAIQHLAGMRTAKTIVAINRDADAPIFGVADYGLIGDLFEILPPLAAEIRRARGEP